MSRENKTVQCAVKALGTTTNDAGQEFGQIECYAAVFNVVDEGNDRIMPQAFKRTLRASKDRAVSRGKRYLLPMLYQHDTKDIIGGWHTIIEDNFGLKCQGDINLQTQRGREYWELARAGMSDSFSIIYEVMPQGSKYTKDGVRELSELRLFSCDPVTFAMCDETYLVGVKAAGGDDDAEAQQARAKRYGIGVKDGGHVTKPGKYASLSDDEFADPVNYSYPIDTKAHADNAASRFGDPDNRAFYTKAEQAIIDKRIAAAQKKFGESDDDDADDSEKGRSMPTRDKAARQRQRKTFAEHYQEERCSDLLDDWCDVVLCAFTCAVHDAFTIGDEPEADVNDALDGLKGAVAEWVADAVKYGLSDYLDAIDNESDPGLSRMQQGTSPGYGWMSRRTPLHRKAMTAGDATTGGFTADHVAKLRGAADRATKAVARHVATLHDAAEDVKTLVGGASAAGGTAAKAGRTFSAANATALADHADALDGAADTLQKAMKRHLGTVGSVADDLATVLQGSEPAYGTDPGDAGDMQEGKARRAPLPATAGARAPHSPPSPADTASEEEVARALAELRSLRTSA